MEEEIKKMREQNKEAKEAEAEKKKQARRDQGLPSEDEDEGSDSESEDNEDDYKKMMAKMSPLEKKIYHKNEEIRVFKKEMEEKIEEKLKPSWEAMDDKEQQEQLLKDKDDKDGYKKYKIQEYMKLKKADREREDDDIFKETRKNWKSFSMTERRRFMNTELTLTEVVKVSFYCFSHS